MEKNTRWRRVNRPDIVRNGRGKRNQFGGSEWLKLCASHASRYGEWIQSQTCIREGCNDNKADVTRTGSQAQLHSFHLGRDDATKGQGVHQLKSRVSSVPSQSPNVSLGSNPCEQPINTPGGRRRNRVWGGSRHGGEAIDGGIPPLTRAMDLQKRVREFEKCGVGAKENGRKTERRRSVNSNNSDRPSPQSEGESSVYPPGLSAKLTPIPYAPERRRSEGAVQVRPGRY